MAYDRRTVLAAAGAGVAGTVLPTGGAAGQSEGSGELTVYFGSADQTVYAVDAVTGEEKWAFTEPDDVVDSSPIVTDDVVFVGCTRSTRDQGTRNGRSTSSRIR